MDTETPPIRCESPETYVFAMDVRVHFCMMNIFAMDFNPPSQPMRCIRDLFAKEQSCTLDVDH